MLRLMEITVNRGERHSYTAYGFAATAQPAKIAIGFNGEHLLPQTSLYILGSGYRAFSPSLHRFYSADNLSPFNTGGLNAYAYCSGDPVNRIDPTGHSGLFIRLLKGIGNIFGRKPGRNVPNPIVHGAAQVNRTASKPSASLTYTSFNSRSSSGSISSGNASVDSYTSISTSSAPSFPLRLPPSSSGSTSRFSKNNLERLPTGRKTEEVWDWIKNSTTDADQELREFSLIIREGGNFNGKYSHVIEAGTSRSADYQLATITPRIPTLYSDGRLFYWRDPRP